MSPQTPEERIAKLEQRVDDMTRQLQTDIKSRLDGLDKKVWGILISIITLLSVVVGALISNGHL